MTHENYLSEHGSDTYVAGSPHFCAACGEAIAQGNVEYTDGVDHLHAECFLEWATDYYSTEYFALLMGFDKREASE